MWKCRRSCVCVVFQPSVWLPISHYMSDPILRVGQTQKHLCLFLFFFFSLGVKDKRGRGLRNHQRSLGESTFPVFSVGYKSDIWQYPDDQIRKNSKAPAPESRQSSQCTSEMGRYWGRKGQKGSQALCTSETSSNGEERTKGGLPGPSVDIRNR